MDKIRVEVELDLQDLHHYVQTSEEGYADYPVSITDAVVAQAAQQIVKQALDQATMDGLRARVAQIQTEVITQLVRDKIEAVLNQGVQRTNDWGEPTGPVIPVTELVDKEIKKQLTPGGGGRGYDSRPSVLDQVISANVNTRLTTDLNEAFLTARQAMLKAAQDAGAAALRAAVTKAVG